MNAVGAYELRGGAHDGERCQPSPPPPDTLFGITTADGERFARSGEAIDHGDGKKWLIFRFDADGSATQAARRRFGNR